MRNQWLTGHRPANRAANPQFEPSFVQITVATLQGELETEHFRHRSHWSRRLRIRLSQGVVGRHDQRVGFARAMVVKPQLLLMDEPFSALDVLTAETLRTNMIDLWIEGRLPAKSVLIVTHNIEEAVLLCDRILMFSSNPGRVAHEIKVGLTHPRRRTAPAFRKLVDDIYGRMTKRSTPDAVERHAPDGIPGTGFGMMLPPIGTNELAGLLETLAASPYDGKADLGCR